jgi:hypothetical protein
MTLANPNLSPAHLEALYESHFQALKRANVKELTRIRKDLLTWRRGSAQVVLKINPNLNNVSIYSVLITGVKPSIELYRYLLGYNTLQRREALGLFEQDNKLYVILKYTMELELATIEVVQRHVFALQEVADELDTELASKFGGKLRFEDWDKLDQGKVDNLLTSLFD